MLALRCWLVRGRNQHLEPDSDGYYGVCAEGWLAASSVEGRHTGRLRRLSTRCFRVVQLQDAGKGALDEGPQRRGCFQGESGGAAGASSQVRLPPSRIL